MNAHTLNQTRNRLTDRLDAGLNLIPLKTTALAYLSEARSREQYEHMAEILRYAREFGASEREVRQILVD